MPCGTISTPSVREVCFASEVPAGVRGTLNFTLRCNRKTSWRLCRRFTRANASASLPLAPPQLLCYNTTKGWLVMKFIYFVLTILCALPAINLIVEFVDFLSSKSFSGVLGFFTFILYIIGIIFFLFLFIVVLCTFAGQIIKEKLQKTLPIITDNAKVISKHNKITGRNTHTHFYVAFELESGERKQFEITNEQYSFLVEGEMGKLYYKEGKGFAFFEKFEVNKLKTEF